MRRPVAWKRLYDRMEPIIAAGESIGSDAPGVAPAGKRRDIRSCSSSGYPHVASAHAGYMLLGGRMLDPSELAANRSR